MELAGPFSRQEIVKRLRQFISELYSGLSVSNEVRWIDDTPFNAHHVDFLTELFPKRGFIYISRDPRDVVSSMRKFKWAPQNIERIARWVKYMRDDWEQVRDKCNREIYEISIESLVASTEKHLREMAEYLSLQWDSQLLDIDLKEHNIGRYKGDLSSEELEKVERVLGPYITRTQ